MLEKVHSVESIQYVLTQLADLTDDEKYTTLLVKASQGLVRVLYIRLIHVWCMFYMVCETNMYSYSHIQYTCTILTVMFTGTNFIVHF